LRALIGLGNPGRHYQITRHNAGFLFLDYLTDKLKIPFSPGKGDYYFSEAGFAGEKLILIKPVTYMNRSGFAVHQVMEHFAVSFDELLVIYDDYHLPFGTIRFRAKGSDAGHNGIKSIIYELQTETFNRLKIGIGGPFDDSVDFVLSDFSKGEIDNLEKIFEFAVNGIESWVESGIEKTMSLYNRNLNDDVDI